MDNGIMCDRNIVANRCFCFLIRTMNDGSVLYIGMMANPDLIYITPNNSIEPYGAIIAYLDIAYDRGVGRLPIVISKLRENPLYR